MPRVLRKVEVFREITLSSLLMMFASFCNLEDTHKQKSIFLNQKQVFKSCQMGMRRVELKMDRFHFLIYLLQTQKEKTKESLQRVIGLVWARTWSPKLRPWELSPFPIWLTNTTSVEAWGPDSGCGLAWPNIYLVYDLLEQVKGTIEYPNLHDLHNREAAGYPGNGLGGDQLHKSLVLLKKELDSKGSLMSVIYSLKEKTSGHTSYKSRQLPGGGR